MNASRSRQRHQVRRFGWMGAAALLAIGLLPGLAIEGVSASHVAPAPIAAGNPQVDADPTPSPTPVATPTPSPTPTPVATPTPQPTPTPTPAPTPNILVGYWEGTVVVGDDPHTRIGIFLEACGPSGRCGEITQLDPNGAGCSFDLRQVEPDDEGISLPAEPPLADDQLVYEVGESCFDCSDSWLESTTIYVRPMTDGTIEVTPAMLLGSVPIFSLAPAARPAPQPMAVTVDTATLVRGRQLTVSVTGFLFAVVLIESENASIPIGTVELDERGSGTLVATVPRDAPLGPADLLAEGFGRNRCEGGALVKVTVVAGPVSATALPTLPPTHAASPAAPSNDWHIALIGLSALIAGIFVLGPRPAAGSRRLARWISRRAGRLRPGRAGP